MRLHQVLEEEASALRAELLSEKDRRMHIQLQLEDQLQEVKQTADELKLQLASVQDCSADLQLQLEEREEVHVARTKVLLEEAEEYRQILSETQESLATWRHRAEVARSKLEGTPSPCKRSDSGNWSPTPSEAWEDIMGTDNRMEAKLRVQNRELTLTLRQFRQDLEILEAENTSLREASAIMEDDLDRVTGCHAELLGHVNHRQKIRYTMKLKEEIGRLIAELKKARRRIVQLEVGRDSENLIEALSSFSSLSGKTKEPRCARLQGLAQPRRCAKATRQSRGPDEDVRLEEVERKCEMQQNVLESITVDFQHVKALIERVVMLADTERRCGGQGSFAALLQRLREVIAGARRGGSDCETPRA